MPDISNPDRLKLGGSAGSTLIIRLFGGFEALVNERLVQCSDRRSGEYLLALLVLAPEAGVPRDWLWETIWPDKPRESAQANLRNALSRLRKALGVDEKRFITAVGNGPLRLDNATVDLWEFRKQILLGDAAALRQAVAWYKGPLLKGWNVDWAIDPRRRSSEDYRLALRSLAKMESRRQCPLEAGRLLRLALDEDPFCESTCYDLIEALFEGGEYTNALQTYRDFRQLCLDEFQCEPGPELRALNETVYRRVRKYQEAALRKPLLRGTGSFETRNLRNRLNPLVGRQQEIEDVVCEFQTNRLVTITGLGGIGKTRVAEAITLEMASYCADGACVVPLDSVRSPESLVEAIATALQIPAGDEHPLGSQVLSYLQRKQLILLLDNCDALESEALLAIESLLEQARHLLVLATCRVPLGIVDEANYRLTNLGTPVDGSWTSPEMLIRSDSVRLFSMRARAADDRFELGPDNAHTVVRICQILGGHPQALELMAGQLTVLTVEQLLRQLESRHYLSAAPRLRALVEWSFQGLHEAEGELLHRLTVFGGGWLPWVAERVCFVPREGGPTFRELMTILIRRSLVERWEQSGTRRYRLPNIVRDYLLNRAQASDYDETISSRYVALYASLARQTLDDPRHPDEFLIARIQDEYRNLLAAFELARIELNEKNLREIVRALVWFWDSSGRCVEGYRMLSSLLVNLPLASAAPLKAIVQISLGKLAMRYRDYRSAESHLHQCLSTAEESEDRRLCAAAMRLLGSCASQLGDFARASSYYERSIGIYVDLGESNLVNDIRISTAVNSAKLGDTEHAKAQWRACLLEARGSGQRGTMALVLFNLAERLISEGEHADAIRSFHESLLLATRLGDQWLIAATHAGLGKAYGILGKLDEAQESLEISLRIRFRSDEVYGIANSLCRMGYVAVDRRDYIRAIRLWSFSEKLLDDATPHGADQGLRLPKRSLSSVLEHLDEIEATKIWWEVRGWSLREVIEYALRNDGIAAGNTARMSLPIPDSRPATPAPSR